MTSYTSLVQFLEDLADTIRGCCLYTNTGNMKEHPLTATNPFIACDDYVETIRNIVGLKQSDHYYYHKLTAQDFQDYLNLMVLEIPDISDHLPSTTGSSWSTHFVYAYIVLSDGTHNLMISLNSTAMEAATAEGSRLKISGTCIDEQNHTVSTRSDVATLVPDRDADKGILTWITGVTGSHSPYNKFVCGSIILKGSTK